MALNKKYLPLKAHFFFFFGTGTPVLRFMMLIAVQLGIPLALQGSLSAFAFLFNIVGKLAVAGIADTFPAYRKVIFLATLSVMVLSLSSIRFIPPIQGPSSMTGKLINVQDLRASNNSWSSELSNDLRNTSDSNLPETNHWMDHILDTLSKERKTEDYSTDPLLFIAADNSSSTHITIGYECSASCSSEHCPLLSEEEGSRNVSIKRIQEPNNLQEMANATDESSKSALDSSHSVSEVADIKLFLVKGLRLHSDTVSVNVSIECTKQETTDTTSRGSSHPTAWKSWQFWLLASLVILGQMAFSTSVSVTDAIIVDTVGEKGSYGIQRAFGTMGWGVIAPINGVLVDWWSGNSDTKDYTPAFYFSFVIGTIDIILSSFFLKVPDFKEDSNIMKNLRPLLRQPRFFIFCCFVLLNGFFDGLIVKYIVVLQEELARKTGTMDHLTLIQGLTIFVQCATEIPFMFVCDWCLKKLSATKVMSLVFFLYIIRLLGQFVAGTVGSIWISLASEMLSGPCYGLGYTAIIVYGSKITPPGTSNTVQSFINICFESFGYGLAMFVGGLVFKEVGGPYMYLVASGVAAITCVLHIISWRVFPLSLEEIRKNRQSDNLQEMQHEEEEAKALTATDKSQ